MKMTKSVTFYLPTIRTGFRYKRGLMYQRSGTIVLATKTSDNLTGTVVSDPTKTYPVGYHANDWAWFRAFNNGMVQLKTPKKRCQ